MALPRAAAPLLRALGSERGRKLDARVVRFTGHSPYAALFARQIGSSYRRPIAVTTIGRRSGRRRTIAISYTELPDGFAIVASAGGSPREPHWLANLREDPVAWVHLGRREIPVRASILEGDAKQPLWDEICARVPLYADYQAKAGRDIPVVVLRPEPGRAGR